MRLLIARVPAEDLTIGAMQRKVLQTLQRVKPSDPIPTKLFNTRGSGVRKHTLTDMMLRGLVAAKPAKRGGALDFVITPLGAKVLKLGSVAKLPPTGYRKVQANGRRRVA